MARRKREEDHENHERWLVSYADFITLLFAFFVIMYAISVVNVGKFKVASESIVASFKNSLTKTPLPETQSKQVVLDKIAIKPVIKPTIVTSKTAEEKAAPNEAQAAQEAEERLANMKKVTADLLKALEDSLKNGQVKVTETDRGLSIDINASSLFDLGSATLRPEALGKLKEVAKVLSRSTQQIEVEGHTDNLVINSPIFPSNWELSTARASSVVRQFAEGGVAPTRMVAVGYAENRPIQPNDTPEGRARNRRVTVMVLKEERDRVAAADAAAANTMPAPQGSTAPAIPAAAATPASPTPAASTAPVTKKP